MGKSVNALITPPYFLPCSSCGRHGSFVVANGILKTPAFYSKESGEELLFTLMEHGYIKEEQRVLLSMRLSKSCLVDYDYQADERVVMVVENENGGPPEKDLFDQLIEKIEKREKKIQQIKIH